MRRGNGGEGEKGKCPLLPLQVTLVRALLPLDAPVLGAMRPLLEVESRSRCHKAALCPLPILVSALTE